MTDRNQLREDIERILRILDGQKVDEEGGDQVEKED